MEELCMLSDLIKGAARSKNETCTSMSSNQLNTYKRYILSRERSELTEVFLRPLPHKLADSEFG